MTERKAGRDSIEAWQMLRMDGGSAWELLTSLMAYQPNKRLSAAAALRHRWFGSSVLAPVGAALDSFATSVGQVCRFAMQNDCISCVMCNRKWQPCKLDSL